MALTNKILTILLLVFLFSASCSHKNTLNLAKDSSRISKSISKDVFSSFFRMSPKEVEKYGRESVVALLAVSNISCINCKAYVRASSKQEKFINSLFNNLGFEIKKSFKSEGDSGKLDVIVNLKPHKHVPSSYIKSLNRKGVLILLINENEDENKIYKFVKRKHYISSEVIGDLKNLERIKINQLPAFQKNLNESVNELLQ